MIYGEYGLFLKLFRGFESAREKILWGSELTIYGDVKEYVEDHSSSKDLGYANFRFVFFFFFLVCSNVFLAFSAHRLIELVKKNRPKKTAKKSPDFVNIANLINKRFI